MIEFYIKFFVTNILFSVIIGALLIRFSGLRNNKESSNRYTVWELLVYSLGLGPMVTVLLLYYLLLVFPSKSGAFYVSMVFGTYTLLAIVARKSFVLMWQRTCLCLSNAAGTWKTTDIKKKLSHLLYWGIVAVLLLSFVFVYTGIVSHNRLEGHDMLIYGNFGKMYFNTKQIVYSKDMIPASTGFVFKGSPKPSFSLLLTWEYILNNSLLNNSSPKNFYSDSYFRSISGYYFLLIIMTAFLWLFRQNRWLALLGIGLLMAGLSFFLTLVDFHLDSFRIFFLMVAWIWLAYAIKDGTEQNPGNYFPIAVLGMFSGFAAFAHLIGLVAVMIIGFVFFVFYPANIIKRIAYSALFLAIVVAMGGIHYIMEVLYGSSYGFLNYLL